MDKVGRYFLFGLFALIIVSSFVSAAPGPVESIRSFFSGLFDLIRPITDVVLGETSASSGTLTGDEVLLVKILFLVVAYSVCYLAFKQIPLFASSQPILYILSIAVSLLATRWITDNTLVQSILLPYTVLGVALTAIIPFVTWFLVVDLGVTNRSLRRLAWIFFAVIFIFLWFYRYGELGGGTNAWALWIYPITAFLALIMAYADGTIQRFRQQIKAESAGRDTSEDVVIKLRTELAELPDLVARGIITDVQAKERQKKIIKKLEYIGATFSPSI